MVSGRERGGQRLFPPFRPQLSKLPGILPLVSPEFSMCVSFGNGWFEMPYPQFAHQSQQVLDPELHRVVPFDTINLTPHETGCCPRESDKTGTGKESCNGDVVTGAQGVIIGTLNSGEQGLACII